MADTILEALDDLLAAVESLTITLGDQTVMTDVSVQCCEDVAPYYPDPLSEVEVGEGDPPDPYADWPAYEVDRCKRAWSATHAADKALKEIYDKQEIGSALGVGVISVILIVVLAPFAVAIAIGGILLTGVFELSFTVLRNRSTAMLPDLMCAIWLSTTAAEALVAVAAVIDASDLDAQSKKILTRIYNDNLITAVFDQTLAIDPAAPTTCDCGSGDTLMRTAMSSPYNVVEVGTLTNGGEEDNAAQGWRSLNNGQQLTINFETPAFTVTEWEITYHVGNGSSHVLRTPQTYIERWTGTEWANHWFKQWDPVYADEDNILNESVNTDPLLPNTTYRFRAMIFEYLNSLWSREHLIEVIEP